MFNRERTKEEYGYDLDLTIKRRTNIEVQATQKTLRKDLMVIDNCPICNMERHIKLRTSRKNNSCSKCFHNTSKMLKIKQNQSKLVSEETKQRMRKNHWSKTGKIESPFKGKTHSILNKELLSKKVTDIFKDMTEQERLENSIKISCGLQQISREEFNGFSTSELQRLRGSLEYKQFEAEVYLAGQFCEFPGCICSTKSQLTVHHKNGFHWSKEGRIDPSNGSLLCETHHYHFHNEYGRKNNTTVQYQEWINKYIDFKNKDIILYVVIGASGSGKSWICKQLSKDYNYISYDDTPKEQHIMDINNSKINALYDPHRKGSTFIKRYRHNFNMKLIVINEDFDVVKQRIQYRKITNPTKRDIITDKKIMQYVNRFKTIAKKADFAGTSSEVLKYLQSKLKS